MFYSGFQPREEFREITKEDQVRAIKLHAMGFRWDRWQLCVFLIDGKSLIINWRKLTGNGECCMEKSTLKWVTSGRSVLIGINKMLRWKQHNNRQNHRHKVGLFLDRLNIERHRDMTTHVHTSRRLWCKGIKGEKNNERRYIGTKRRNRTNNATSSSAPLSRDAGAWQTRQNPESIRISFCFYLFQLYDYYTAPLVLARGDRRSASAGGGGNTETIHTAIPVYTYFRSTYRRIYQMKFSFRPGASYHSRFFSKSSRVLIPRAVMQYSSI